MNILITGGEGFIARSIKASPLFEEYGLYAPSHAELDITKSITRYVWEHGIDFIIHAAVDTRECKEAFDNNVMMLANVLECSPEVRGILCFGSGIELCTAYAQEKKKLHYQAFKRMQKTYIANSGYNNISTMQIYGAFGPLEDESRFTSKVLDQVMSGGPIQIEQDRLFTYTYIDDILEYIKYKLDKVDNGGEALIIPYYIRSLLRMAYIIKGECGVSVPIIVTNEEEGANYTPHAGLAIYSKNDAYFAESVRKMIEARKACLTPLKE